MLCCKAGVIVIGFTIPRMEGAFLSTQLPSLNRQYTYQYQKADNEFEDT